MTPVHAIFDAFDGSPTKIGKAIGAPVQTVSDWKNKGKAEIPHWRRPAVLDAARRLNIALPPEAIEYLCSSAPAEAA